MKVTLWANIQEGSQTWDTKLAHKTLVWPPFLPLPMVGDLLCVIGEADPKDPEIDDDDIMVAVSRREFYPEGDRVDGELSFASIETANVVPERGGLSHLYDRLEANGWVTFRSRKD